MVNWNKFKFIIGSQDIQEIYVDNDGQDYYVDANRLQNTPLWDKYHNLRYWLSKGFLNDISENVIDSELYEDIRICYRNSINKKSGGNVA